jgi:hypothetical protein
MNVLPGHVPNALPYRHMPSGLVVSDGYDLLNTPAPPREWLVEGWIPAGDVSLLAGDGGTGKTLLALQLAIAAAYDTPWLDRTVMHCPSVFFCAEESMPELHYRVEKLATPLISIRPLPRRLRLISAAHTDAELITFEAGAPMTSPILSEVERGIGEMRAGLLVIDAQADAFGGDEVDRRQVRTFVRKLRELALRNRCAVLLLAHPSVDGMRSGRGYSGSTHWSNSVRSRMYFTAVTGNPELRNLELMKSNRARKGECILMRWVNDRFVVETAMSADRAGHEQAREVFLDLMRVMARTGQKVTHKPGSSYAPSIFAEHPKSQGIEKRGFAFAMQQLLDDGEIETYTTGPKSRRVTYIRIVEEKTGEEE